MPPKTLSIVSLGCFRNSYDSEIVLRRFLDKGYILKEGLAASDLLIVNTCGFIDKAKQESIEVIRQAVRLKKRGQVKKLLVCGCLVERYRKELKSSFPTVDLWQGVEKFNQAFLATAQLQAPWRAFLKICEGCFNRCSYCAIPLIKGGLRSKPKQEVLREAVFLESRGVKELTLIGQDITSWGKDLAGRDNLTSLIKAILAKTKNIKWLRLIYAHPRHLDDSLIDLVAGQARICKYIDLPLQHINDRILKLMNRRLARRDIERLIRKIRKSLPGCFIRSSVIVGFPGESEKEFRELLDFLRNVKFERLGAFS